MVRQGRAFYSCSAANYFLSCFPHQRSLLDLEWPQNIYFLCNNIIKILMQIATLSSGETNQMIIYLAEVISLKNKAFGLVSYCWQDPTFSGSIRLCNFGFGDFPTSSHELISLKLLFHTVLFL